MAFQPSGLAGRRAGLLVLAALLMAACGIAPAQSKTASSRGEPISIKFADPLPDDFAAGAGCSHLAKLMNERSHRRFKVQYFGNGALGVGNKVAEDARAGVIQMACLASANMSFYTSAFAVFDLPYIARSADSIHQVWDSKLGEDILAKTEPLGWKALAVYDYDGLSAIMNDVRPVRTPADLTGLKIRVLNSPVLIGTLKAWGANPVPMLFDKVYSALLQHLVDGEIHSYALTYTSHHVDLIKYVAEIDFAYNAQLVLMNGDLWKNLNTDDKKLLQSLARESMDFQRKLAATQRTEYRAKFLEKGVQIYVPTPDEAQQWRAAVVPSVWHQFADQVGGQAMIQSVLDAQKR
jgi:tripartite ATP-independent transporter DctP family solute receptor